MSRRATLRSRCWRAWAWHHKSRILGLKLVARAVVWAIGESESKPFSRYLSGRGSGFRGFEIAIFFRVWGWGLLLLP